MKSFAEFTEHDIFFESLDTAVEFEMTEDTILPKQIYATANINGSDYGMSLVETTYDKVYMIELYRIVSVKKRTWSFKTPSDIRPVLSTFLKFMEASYPFIRNRMNGIIIDIPGKTGSERYQSLLTRILKKTYIQTFRVVPVKKISDGARNYIFVTKKSVSPEMIFKTAVFKKHFEFDPTNMEIEDIITSENIEKITVPYRKQKEIVSTTPSKRYAFKKLDLGNEIDSQDVKLIDDISNKAVKSKGGSNVVDLLKSDEVVGDKVEEPPLAKISLTYKQGDDIHSDNIPLAGLIKSRMTWSLNSALNKLGKEGNKMDDKYLVSSLKSVFKSIYKYDSSITMRKIMVNMGLTNDNGLMKIGVKNKKMWEQVLNDVIDMTPEDAKSARAAFIAVKNIDTAKASDMYKTTLDSAKVLELPFAVQAKKEAFSGDNATKWDNGLGFGNTQENITEKINVVKSYKSYNQFATIFEKWAGKSIDDSSSLSEEEREELKAVRSFRSYTGTGYKIINPNLRKSLSSIKTGDFYLDSNSDAMFKFYSKYAVEMEDDVWVYRNAKVPGQGKFEPGDVFVDPAWLSTSLSTQVSMGEKPDSMRMKIFLPKGTRCIPVLNFSGVPGEKEIMLPPFSRIRFTEVYHTTQGTLKKPYVVGVYTGNGAESFYEAYKKGADDLKMLFENKKQDDKKTKKSESVWDEELLSLDDMKDLEDKIAKGKIKITY
jgi:hypothetical protein